MMDRYPDSGRIVLKLDDDTLEVFAERGEFRGRAAADHPLLANDLSAFARRLTQFPLPPTEVGFTGSGSIDLSIRQTNLVGHIELRVTLGRFFPEASVLIVIRLDYETVARLARELEQLLENSSGEIVVMGNPS